MFRTDLPDRAEGAGWVHQDVRGDPGGQPLLCDTRQDILKQCLGIHAGESTDAVVCCGPNRSQQGRGWGVAAYGALAVLPADAATLERMVSRVTSSPTMRSVPLQKFQPRWVSCF